MGIRIEFKTVKILSIKRFSSISDAWHISKSLMIIFQASSIVCAWIGGPPLLDIWWYYLSFLILLGICWNVVFSIFYEIILIR